MDSIRIGKNRRWLYEGTMMEIRVLTSFAKIAGDFLATGSRQKERRTTCPSGNMMSFAQQLKLLPFGGVKKRRSACADVSAHCRTN